MANIKISNLPEYSGNPEGVYVVINNSGNTTTYIVDRNTFLQNIATLGSNSFTGNQSINGLLDLPLTSKNYDDPGTPGQICWDTNYIYVCVDTNLWRRVDLQVFGITPTPTTTPTNTPTVTQTPAVTPTNTPTVTPTNTPTPSPVWLFVIQNSNTTRSVTSVTFNGVQQSLTLGSYPVLNGNAYSGTILGCSGIGGDVMQINFGGTGFCGPNSKILKNGVDTGFPLAGYANSTFTLGGYAISASDKIQIIID